jgi:hypothetical protein
MRWSEEEKDEEMHPEFMRTLRRLARKARNRVFNEKKQIPIDAYLR